MPPASFVGKATGSNVGATFSFVAPAQTQPGDEYVMIVASSGIGTFELDDPVNAEIDWLDAANVVNAELFVVRRRAEEGDPPTISIKADAAPAWALSVLFVYRQLRDVASVGMSGSQITASVNFPCPSRVLAEYSDLYLGIVAVTTAATLVLRPANTTKLHEEQTGGRTLAVFELLAETGGATGAVLAATGAPQSGGTASVALAVVAPLVALTLVPDVPGAIGFVEVGV